MTFGTDGPLTAARAREVLSYDPGTGALTRIGRRRRATPGTVAGNLTTNGYLRLMIDGRKYAAHRVAWLIVHGEWPPEQIDHINGVRTDNRLCNLRLVSNAENMQNQRRPTAQNSTSGLIGASWNKRLGAWVAQIKRAGKTYYIGKYPSAMEAHEAYVSEKRRMHPACTI